MYGKELCVWILKVKYGKVTNTEVTWSIIGKSVMIIIFVEFIDKLIDYPINRASLRRYPWNIAHSTVICYFMYKYNRIIHV